MNRVTICAMEVAMKRFASFLLVAVAVGLLSALTPSSALSKMNEALLPGSGGDPCRGRTDCSCTHSGAMVICDEGGKKKACRPDSGSAGGWLCQPLRTVGGSSDIKAPSAGSNMQNKVK